MQWLSSDCGIVYDAREHMITEKNTTDKQTYCLSTLLYYMKDTFEFLQVTCFFFVLYEALLHFTGIDGYMKNL